MKQDFKRIYIDWLYNNAEQHKISDCVYQLILPFLDRNNDFIELFIEMPGNGNYRITDGAETINELELSQFDIFGSQRKKNIFHSVLAAHGVSISESNELYVICSEDNLAPAKHMLSQCIIKINMTLQLKNQRYW